MQTIAERLKTAQDSIDAATTAVNRPTNSVKLLAVSKTKPVSDIKLAYEYGQRLFGENYIQEGVEKVTELAELSDIEWHMIGPIQSNKTKDVANHFDWVQSVDRLKIARRLNDQRPTHKAPLNICIQVNVEAEASKSGVALNELDALVAEVESLPNLTLRGLMAIPAPDVSDAQQRQTLSTLKQTFDRLAVNRSQFDTLSVGMSNDMQLAIAHGSTMVRIGTAIFGARTKKQVNE